jgi:4a-hydroxytetrahydrobiopterin dehydratase
MHLYEQHCLTETLPQLLTKEQLQKHLEEIPQWNIEKENKNISRKFKFNDYHQTLKFINAVAAIVNQENHHPEINFGYNNCTINFSTHSAGGITLFDFICAAHIEQLISTSDFNV